MDKPNNNTVFPVDMEEIIFNNLEGQYKHYCPEWDFMAIDETWLEFDYCSCEFSTIWDNKSQTWIKLDNDDPLGYPHKHNKDR